MTRIAVIGPGAIGGTVAARLAQRPDNAVSICAKTPLKQLRIDTPQGLLVANPDVLLDPDQAGTVDWVLIATKAYDVAGAASWLRKLVRPGTRIAVLQNGVEHLERSAPHVAATSLVPVVVDLPAERTAPGHVRQRRNGKLTVSADANGHDFAWLFVATGLSVATVADFRTHAWRKLALNSAGAVSALTLKSAGIANCEPVGDIMRELVRECIAVGGAEGAALDDALIGEVLASYRTGPPDAINSLHADRLAGRPLELDARNGAIVRIGRRHGLATPVNQMMVALLEAACGPDVTGPSLDLSGVS